MRDKRGENTAGSILTSVMAGLLVLILLLIIVFSAYFVYLNIPGEEKRLDVKVSDGSVANGNIIFGDVKQFHPNMKYNHNQISYKIGPGCNNEQRSRMVTAFDRLSFLVNGLIKFKEGSGEVDIEVFCSKDNGKELEKSHFVAGEGGAKEIVKAGKYNVINGGTILLYENPNRFLKCEWPNIELHELLHVLGFDHTENPNSLMYSYLESCEQEIDKSIIEDLISLYSEENLPDLTFEDINVVKKGRYLDFNLTIRNAGVVNATNVEYSILDDGKLVESRKIGVIAYGGGIKVKVENFKLLNRDPDEIEFVIDMQNKIKELNEGNNVASISLG